MSNRNKSKFKKMIFRSESDLVCGLRNVSGGSCGLQLVTADQRMAVGGA